MELSEAGTTYGTVHVNVDMPFAGQDELYNTPRLLFTFESIFKDWNLPLSYQNKFKTSS